MITLVADDITGAAEVAGICLRYGLTVSFGINTVPTEETQARVIATDSRSMSMQEARMLHRRLAQEIGPSTPQHVFRKTDSVLRGYIVAELDEWMDELNFDTAILQPSNPALGRCILHGNYLVNGKPLNETSFRNDSDFPAWTSSVEGLLMERNGNRLSRKIHTGLPSPQKTGLFIPDCRDDFDLKKSVSKSNHPIIHAGSAAFLAAWLEEIHGLTALPPRNKINPTTGRFLMVCGSKHAQSVEYITASRKKGLAVAEFPEDLLQEKVAVGLLEEWADNQAEFWGRTGQMLVTQGHRPVTFPDCSLALRTRLAEVVHRLLVQCSVGELLLEGGATAFAVFEREGWKSLKLIQEFCPGVVRMAVNGMSSLFVTLKPGSYTWPDWDCYCPEMSVPIDVTD